MKNNKYILLTNTARNIVTARKKSEEIQIARILNRAVSPPITTKTNILAVNLKDTIKDVSISDLVIEYTSERSAISLTPVPKIDIISEDNSLFLFSISYPIYIPVILQVASLLAALTHPGHIVTYAPGDSLPCRRDAS